MAVEPTRYQSKAEAASAVGLLVHRLEVLIRTDRFPDADVRVGENRPKLGSYGWGPGRVVEAGLTLGLLSPDGTPIRRKGGPPRLDDAPWVKPAHWHVRTQAYMSLKQVGKLFGLKEETNLLNSPTFIQPAVLVGRIRGYDTLEIVKLGMRTRDLHPGQAKVLHLLQEQLGVGSWSEAYAIADQIAASL